MEAKCLTKIAIDLCTKAIFAIFFCPDLSQMYFVSGGLMACGGQVIIDEKQKCRKIKGRKTLHSLVLEHFW